MEGLVSCPEISLQDYIIDVLKDQYGTSDDLWWYEGIPNAIRTTARMEEDKNKRGDKEFYFDLIDYKKILLEIGKFLKRSSALAKAAKTKD
jgi:DNA sulfur modification protein DndB